MSNPLATLLDEATATALLTLSTEGRLEHCCPTVARLLGETPAALLGEYLAPRLVPVAAAGHWLAALERGEIQGLRHRDGHAVPLTLHPIPLTRAGAPTGWLIHVRPPAPGHARFAARRSAERSLAERLQALGEWSRRLAGTSETTALRLLAQQAVRQLSDETAQLQLAADDGPQVHDILLGPPACPLGWIRPRTEQPLDPAIHLILDQLALLLTPLLERQALHARQRELERRLAREQGVLASVLQQSPLGIAITDADGDHPVHLNPRIHAMLGPLPAGSLDERYRASGALHADGRAYAVDDYPTVRVLRSGQPVAAELLRFRRADGTLRLLEVSSAPVRDPKGGLIAAVTLFDDVQDQRDAQRALHEHGSRLASLVNQAAVGICQTDVEGRLLLANRCYCELLDRPEAAVVGQSLTAQTHPDDRPALAASLAQLRESGEAFKLDQRFPRPDGSLVWAALHGSWLPAQDERPASISLVVVDITRRKQVEAALHRSSLRFRSAVAAVQGVIWTTTADGRLIGEQPAWEALTGQHQFQYREHGWLDALHPDDVSRALRRWQLAVQQQVDFQDEQRVRCRDGQWRIFSVRALPVRENGVVCEWVGVHTDISEIRMAEDRLRRLAELLEQRVQERTAERDRMWRVADDLLGVIQDGRWLSRNPAWSRLGWSAEELHQQGLADLAHPDDTPVFARLAALASGEALGDLPGRLRTRTGEWRHLVWKATADHDGRIYVFGRDTSAEHAAAQALQDAEAALRQAQKMEAIGHLTGGIAHDFNNLLTGISGSLELLRRRLNQGRHDNLQRYLDTAEQSATRAAALTHRLLAFARRQTLDPQPIAVNALVLSLEGLFRRTLGERVGLRCSLAPDLAAVLTDANQLENALLNLVINARDAMPEGGLLTLETSAERLTASAFDSDLPAGDYVRLSLADTGAGMPPEVMERAFDPFFTTKPIGQGTGLGLSMLYGFIKQSGGHVRLDSTLGQGTRVTLWLPCTPDLPANGETPPLPAIGEGRGERLLLVEDDVSVRLLLREMLVELGYRVRTAATATAALALLEDESACDLLITDVGLPDLDGRQLAEQLRARWPDLPVLFVSGHAQQPAPEGTEALGKPFQIDALAHRLRLLLD